MKTATLGLILVSMLAGAVSAPCAQTRVDASAKSPDVQTALDLVAMQGRIDMAPFAARDSVLDEISRRIAASEKVLAAMENRAKSLDSGEQETFKADLAVARTREKDLKLGLEKARRATPDTWSYAQAMLATKYALYADELELLNVVAPVMPQISAVRSE
ncbi:MAG TPA: hypothetical protein VMI53_04695 [Opitutaceae bacterium]|nr:hypothetical protein [Opitutaceae bacterium]